MLQATVYSIVRHMHVASNSSQYWYTETYCKQQFTVLLDRNVLQATVYSIGIQKHDATKQQFTVLVYRNMLQVTVYSIVRQNHVVSDSLQYC